MRSKVVAAEMATAAGIPVAITSGVEREAMARALAGEPAGTLFRAQRGRVSSFKLWLKYAKPTQGRLTIDEGAERALRERGTSLLPVGVVEVDGEFEAGDAVEVRSRGDGGAGARNVGKGIVNYSAGELRRIKGLKTEAVRELLPGRPRRPCTATTSCSTEAAMPALASIPGVPLPDGHHRPVGRRGLRKGTRAAQHLATLDTAVKNSALEAMAVALEQRAGEILEANEPRYRGGGGGGPSSGLLDRLKLTEERLAGIAGDVRAIAALPDPVGETIDGHRLENGLDLRRVRVPIGVVAVVFEARPNVSVDCSALCLKSGNAIVLRGSSIAAHSNAVLAQVAAGAAESAGVPDGAIAIVGGGDRDELRQLATQDGLVDLIIPRGGEGLKAALKEHATVPGDVRRRRQLPRVRRCLGGSG